VTKQTEDRPFLDTNVLIYAFVKDDARQEIARKLLADGGAIGVQTLNEFVAVAKGKLHMSWEEVMAALAIIRVLCTLTVPLTLKTHEAAVRIAARHGYRIYDSLIIAAALEAGCNVLYSEDMRDGHVLQGLAIRNPFRHTAR
jgi:predicted nucleic acid-binding protein